MLKAFLINVENSCAIHNFFRLTVVTLYVIIMNPCSININFSNPLSKKVTLYFKVSLLHKLLVLTIGITLNYA